LVADLLGMATTIGAHPHGSDPIGRKLTIPV
jgi:hypothetical protein